MTDSAIISASYNAEKSYTHNPDDVIDPSGAVGAWGTAKESTTKLVDLSGNGNIADIHGAMPTEGFIQGRRFTKVNGDYLDCRNDSSLSSTDAITIEALVEPSTITDANNSVIGKELEYVIYNDVGSWELWTWNSHSWDKLITNNTVILNKLQHVLITYTGSVGYFYLNGVEIGNQTMTYASSYTNNLSIGAKSGTLYFNGSIVFACINDHAKLPAEIKQNFNAFARLPFWSVNYTDYPDNVTEYTDNLPYSSSIISSGTLKVDDDVLNCVSAGTITYRASYEFDGSEYIKVEIGGVEYAGTGTITQGNTTVSVAQSSNKVTVVMGTGDTINEINIQFREEV